MVEAQRKIQTTEGAAEEKRRQAEFLKQATLKKQEVVMKFKRSNDAVLTVFTPANFNGQGCISCSADHTVRIIKH